MNIQLERILWMEKLMAWPQTFCGQQLVSSARLMTISPARRHTGDTTLEQLYSTGTMVSLSQRYMQQPSIEAFQTSPCARGTPELSVQAGNIHTSPFFVGGWVGVFIDFAQTRIQIFFHHSLIFIHNPGLLFLTFFQCLQKALNLWVLTTLVRGDAEGRVRPVEERSLGADAALGQAWALVRVRIKVVVRTGLSRAGRQTGLVPQSVRTHEGCRRRDTAVILSDSDHKRAAVSVSLYKAYGSSLDSSTRCRCWICGRKLRKQPAPHSGCWHTLHPLSKPHRTCWVGPEKKLKLAYDVFKANGFYYLLRNRHECIQSPGMDDHAEKVLVQYSCLLLNYARFSWLRVQNILYHHSYSLHYR